MQTIFTKLLLGIVVFLSLTVTAQSPGDIITVQTIEFQGYPVGNGWLAPREGYFDFSAVNGLDFEKVYIEYTLKCDPTQSPACGEWDYLSYINVLDHTGRGADPSYIIGGFGGYSPETYAYMDDVSWNYKPRFENTIIYSDPLAFSEYSVGNAVSVLDNPLNSSLEDSKSYFMYKKEELLTAGLTAGNITGMQFNINTAGDEMNNLKIRIKPTTDSVLTDVVEDTNFTEVYSKDTQITTTGWQVLDFTTFFNWNGTSNVIIEVSFTGKGGTTGVKIMGDTNTWNCATNAVEKDNYLEFNGPDTVLLPVNNLATINNEVTVSFWLYGTDKQPQDDSVFEARDADNNRLLNVHLPWSNQRVYWDAGNDTGYDRVDRVASVGDYKGKWNHWAFTKNSTTGLMKIFLNGVLWGGGNGKTRPIGNIDKLIIGRGLWNADNFYDGKIDNFTIWNKALDATTITNLMHKEIDASHPFYSNLVAYYKFDENTELKIIDEITGQQSDLLGVPQHKTYLGNRFKNFEVTTQRPQVKFNRNTSSYTINNEMVIDSFPKGKDMIEKYHQIATDEKPVVEEVIYTYPSYYNNYVYDNNGVATDSTFVTPDHILNLEMISYIPTDPLDEIINKWEIGRYITPYGNGLSLGTDGWTWIFDVTDFQNLLQGDNVHIAAGNFQELLDMKFKFKVGTPPRDLKNIQRVYSGNYSLNTFDDEVVNKTMTLDPTSQMFNIKTTLTGHGFGSGANCGEFCNNTHSVWVNGEEKYSWEIMQECGENPLYPQGGTWIYDRAAWCPGMPATAQNLDLTPFISSGSNTVDLDYNIEHDPFGNYITEIFLVEYGAPNFTTDASIEEIIAPNIFKLNTRFNPTCGRPIVRIKNTGEDTLTSLTITYSVEGVTDTYNYDWTGSLAFLEDEIVELPAMNLLDYYGGNQKFNVSLSNPNGVSDQYVHNNQLISDFELAPVHNQQMIVKFKTNTQPNQNSYKIFDTAGNIVFERDFSSPNTVHTDLMNLPPGCYEFVAYDTGGDGMYNWPSGYGDGYIQLRNADGSLITSLEKWFGEYERYIFRNDAELGVNDYQLDISFSVFPNPTKNVFSVKTLVDVDSFSLELYSLKGNLIMKKNSTDNLTTIDVSNLKSGVYLIHLKTKEINQVQKLIIE